MRREMTVKRVRRKTRPISWSCILLSRPVTHCSLPNERNTALCSMPSCTCIWMVLSCWRMSSVISRKRWAKSLPKATTKGVTSSSANARRASIEYINMNAPVSCTPVTINCGSNEVVTSATVSISLESREVTSPECNWSSYI